MLEVGFPVRRAFDQWNVAGVERRVLAFLIDSVAVVFLVGVGLYFSGRASQWPGYVFFWVVAMWAWEAFWVSWKARTPGRMLTGIFVHSPRTDGAPQSLQVTLRILNFWFGLLFLGIGLTPILFRRDRRGWHDILSETVTLGRYREEPSNWERQIGRGVALLQALVGFSVVGALFMALGLRPDRLASLKFEEPATVDLCADPKTFLDRPVDSLLALSLSPAWGDCWTKTHFGLHALKDSEFFQMAESAIRYSELWGAPAQVRSTMYQQAFGGLTDVLCQGGPFDLAKCRADTTGRSIAAALSKPMSELSAKEVRSRWLKENLDFYLLFASTRSPAERVSLLEKSLDGSFSETVKQAMKDRIWIEQLGMGLRPSRPQPSSISNRWNGEQICWLSALNLEESPACAEHPIPKFYEKLKTLSESDLSLEEAEFYMADLDEQNLPPEFKLAYDIWRTKRSGNLPDAQKGLAKFPATSPLYPLARSWF